MMSQELYQRQLELLAENDFEDMNVDFDEYIANGLKYIGVTDPVLRDDLIFPFLATIAYEGLIDDKKFNDISKKLSDDDHLLYRIDSEDQDAVFTRSFSALALSAILHNHNERKFLKNEVVSELFDQVKCYIGKEQDYRGFVAEKGWAHSSAHIADVIGCFAANKDLSPDQVMELFYIYKDMFLKSEEVFTHNEDERIVAAIKKFYTRPDFSDTYLIKWIESIDKSSFKGSYPEDMYMTINSKLLLRSLYFKLNELDNSEKIIQAVENQLEVFKF